MKTIPEIDFLRISGFKSLIDFRLDDLSPLMVFAGANGSGKSNIFEAVEFFISYINGGDMKIFGTESEIVNLNSTDELLSFEMGKKKSYNQVKLNTYFSEIMGSKNKVEDSSVNDSIINNFSRIFINNYQINRPKYRDDSRLDFYTSNLEKVLKRLLSDDQKNKEIVDNLRFFIPGFDTIKVVTSDLSGTENLIVYEKNTKKPFPRNLLSDGTYNIIALLVAALQSDQPQFLCIEEPENGLHPKVIKELISFFREICETKGHVIWLTTHSPSVVSEVKPEELVMVNKIDGITKVKQFHDKEFFNLTMDEAWLSNVLGGGLPW